ncbi:MAG: PhoU domain-containing protein [Candidatus Micrarchaeota archaeon]
MAFRKIQKTGQSSFTVSLPLDWARAYGLEKNQAIEIEAQVDGTLILHPPGKRGAKFEPVRLQSPAGNEAFLLRQLIGAYVHGCSELVVSDPKGIGLAAHSMVERFLRMSMGMEIMEESVHSIVIKDIANPSEISTEAALRRMAHISRQMVRESMQMLDDGPMDAAGLNGLENDVDRLYLFMERKHQLFLAQPSRAAAEGISLSDSYWMCTAARSMERVGDHALRISRQAPVLRQDGRAAKIRSILLAQGRPVAEAYSLVTQLFFEREPSKANALVESNRRKRPIFDQVLGKAADLPSRVSIRAAYSVSSLRRISELSDNIAEITIDRGGPKKTGR